MDNLSHLKDLLKYDLKHLYSAEEQIIDALPAMIIKANNLKLKESLEEHLLITEQQRDRLNRVQELLGTNEEEENKSIFAGLFGDSDKNAGIAGLINEGEKVMAIDMMPEVMDAAIIGCCQKIEHYEICAYGTARTYAEQLGLIDIAQLLQQTLMEEHDADDRLTSIAIGKVNRQAGGEATAANTMDNPSVIL
jgi:ferritin-like metal-binding protein YciE